ncbi:MAG: family 10 glycosylhydrolase [Planctomycetota bacterium]
MSRDPARRTTTALRDGAPPPSTGGAPLLSGHPERVALAIGAALAGALLLACRSQPLQSGAPELRGTWAVGRTLVGASAVEQIVAEVRDLGANAVFMQVRARGDSIVPSSIEPAAPPRLIQDFDALDVALESARGDIEVHAWVNACLVADPEQMPRDDRHVVYAHPEWLSVPETIARELWYLPPEDPKYLENLVRFARAHKDTVEGVYADPTLPEYRAHVVAVVADLVRRYPVDGIHLDYIRYARKDFGYSRAALDTFRLEVDRELSASDRADMAQRVKKDPTVYARRYPVRFAQFRRDAVTRLVEEVSEAARALRLQIVVSAAVIPDIARARDQHYQAWPQWLERGDLDAACPMIYARDRGTFSEQLRAVMGARRHGQIWVGIGAWQIAAEETVARIDEVRKAGAHGVILFSHAGLKDVPGAVAAIAGGPFQKRCATWKARRGPPQAVAP